MSLQLQPVPLGARNDTEGLLVFGKVPQPAGPAVACHSSTTPGANRTG